MLVLRGHRHQLRDLLTDPRRVTIARQRGIRGDLRTVQRDHREICQPRHRTQPQPFREQTLKRPLVIDHEPGDC